MRTLGLIGGMSWESTAIYYRLLNERVRERLGGLHSAKLLLWSFDFAEIEALQAAGAWEAATLRMVDAARRLEQGGAEALLICTNTMHRMADEVEAAVDVPLIHIADATAGAIGAARVGRPLLLGTRFTMEGRFYRDRLAERHGIEAIVPDDEGRATVNRVIYDELCRGIVSDASRAAYLDIVERAREQGADGVIFGCTEVGMLIGGLDLGVPSFDTTAVHVAAAVDVALA